MSKKVELRKLWGNGHKDWWKFPYDGLVKGFLGTAPLFIVGDQPSTSSWESSNPNRCAFYSLLARLMIPNAHLTDLYKKRGRAEELRRRPLPPDFADHVKFFRKEVEILKPARIVALGNLAYQLISTHVPETTKILTRMWHFSYAVRYQRINEWEGQARIALFGSTGGGDEGPPTVNVAPPVVIRPRGPREDSQRAVMKRCYRDNNYDHERTIACYAEAERSGQVRRRSNALDETPESYAKRLLYDGISKRWIEK